MHTTTYTHLQPSIESAFKLRFSPLSSWLKSTQKCTDHQYSKSESPPSWLTELSEEEGYSLSLTRGYTGSGRSTCNSDSRSPSCCSSSSTWRQNNVSVGRPRRETSAERTVWFTTNPMYSWYTSRCRSSAGWKRCWKVATGRMRCREVVLSTRHWRKTRRALSCWRVQEVPPNSRLTSCDRCCRRWDSSGR